MERGAKTNEIICGDAITAEALAAIPKPNRIIGPVRWYGGKGMLARWIVQQIPKGRLYCEPYCGAASVFWHLRPPREVEVLNDLHAEIITLFRVLQDREQFGELCHRLAWTPYSLDEFRRALAMEAVDGLSDVDRAWAFFTRQNQGFSGRAETEGSCGRAFVSSRGMAEKANTWRGRLASLAVWHDRLSRVQLDNRDALEVIRYWDSEDTVFYLDPPYPSGARVSQDAYRHEVTDGHHQELVEVLLAGGGW